MKKVIRERGKQQTQANKDTRRIFFLSSLLLLLPLRLSHQLSLLLTSIVANNGEKDWAQAWIHKGHPLIEQSLDGGGEMAAGGRVEEEYVYI